jgi:acyl carrier protein
MTRDEILATLREVLRTELGVEAPVELASELAADLGLDSVKLLTLVVELENRLRVALEPASGEELVSVGQVVALIERCLKEQEAAA